MRPRSARTRRITTWYCCAAAASLLCACEGPAGGSRAAEVRANGVELAARGYRRYDQEHGAVSYLLTGDEEGTETLFFDHWGMREARLRQTPGKAATSLTLTDGAATFVVEIAEERAVKTMTPGWQTDPGGQHLGLVRQQTLESLGGRRVGRGRILALPCDRWEVPALGTTSCLWHHLPLATETRLGDTYQRRIAVQVDMDATIPAERFAIPERVRIVARD